MDVTSRASEVISPTESNPLLKTLIQDAITPGHDGAAFAAALKDLGMTSIFDIVRMTRSVFIEQLQAFNIDDHGAGHAYDIAQGYAAQLDRLYRQQQVSPDLIQARQKRTASNIENSQPPDLPTYRKLFNEPWNQFCSSASMAANDSPVAYLRTLYLFALQLETRGTEAARRLDQRRPDLKGFVIDSGKTFNQVPTLSIVNQILKDQLETSVTTATAYELLNKKHYPYSLPYDAYHHACALGLGEKQLQLGELHYRISPRLLAFDPNQSSIEAARRIQPVLSGLSPAQMELLIAAPNAGVTLYEANFDLAPSADLKKQDEAAQEKFLRAQLSQVEVFLDKTGLDASQLQALLSQKTHAPHQSAALTNGDTAGYGAVYVNGGPSPMALLDAGTLSNTTSDRFDRLHKMIRLQRWLGIPFAELDTLLTSAMKREGNEELALNATTLRVLGVFRYWNRVHAVPAEEFAALLFRIPTHATERRVPLFDRLFRSPGTTQQALVLDGGIFDNTTRQRLCAAFGLSDTADSLGLLIDNIPPEEKTSTLAAISAVYRQARVAQLLGLTVQECSQLLELLAPAYRQQWVAPSLANTGATDTKNADYLDMLMHLDWITRWMRDSDVGVSDLRRQMLVVPAEVFPSLRAPKNEDYTDLLQPKTRPLIPELIETYLRDTTSESARLRYLSLLMPNVEGDLQLPVSSETLLHFMKFPGWLDDAYLQETKLELRLHDFYLLHRVKQYVDVYGRSENVLLEYFEWARSASADKKQADTRLAALLGWTAKEVAILTETPGSTRVTAMNQIDWLMRCQQACRKAGFSATTLLKAAELARDSAEADWKTLAEAL